MSLAGSAAPVTNRGAPRRGRVHSLVALVVVLGALTAAAPAQALGIYVALGDSYTAGPLVPNPKGAPIDCGQSDHNYPTLAANQIKPSEFRDVSCGSAQTKDMTGPQRGLPFGGTNPPQFNALSENVELVSVGIGGNDMGFGGIVQTCAELGARSGGTGRPCTDHYSSSGRDEISERLENIVLPRIVKVIEGIQQRSPRARLLVVGYPDPVPQSPGCYPVVPIASGDLDFLHGVARKLHEAVMRAADAGGAEFVDLYTRSFGHDICQPPGPKWYEGIVPTSPAYPAHPNALGMEYAAREVLAVLKRPVPNDFAIVRRRGERTGGITVRLRAPHRGSFAVRGKVLSRRATGRGAAGVRYPVRKAFAARAGEVKVRLRVGHAVRRTLRRGGRRRVWVKVTFTPVAGEPRSREVRVNVGAR